MPSRRRNEDVTSAGCRSASTGATVTLMAANVGSQRSSTRENLGSFITNNGALPNSCVSMDMQRAASSLRAAAPRFAESKISESYQAQPRELKIASLSAVMGKDSQNPIGLSASGSIMPAGAAAPSR